MTGDLTAPIDETHAACLNARDRIRDRHRRATAVVARWQPRPMPTEWRPTP